eukprot:1384237-Pleurochrysis_carterae.AAC.1
MAKFTSEKTSLSLKRHALHTYEETRGRRREKTCFHSSKHERKHARAHTRSHEGAHANCIDQSASGRTRKRHASMPRHRQGQHATECAVMSTGVRYGTAHGTQRTRTSADALWLAALGTLVRIICYKEKSKARRAGTIQMAQASHT